jgi:hypothetical protein
VTASPALKHTTVIHAAHEAALSALVASHVTVVCSNVAVSLPSAPSPARFRFMRRSRIAIGLAAVVIVVVGVLSLTIGQWLWGQDWHVYGGESKQTTGAQERAAMKCAPMLGSVSVLDIFPAEIDIHLHGSAGRANRVVKCLRQSAGIVDAEAVRSS